MGYYQLDADGRVVGQPYGVPQPFNPAVVELPDDAPAVVAHVAQERVAALLAYAKARRNAVWYGGLTLNGVRIATDEKSQNKVANAYAGMLASGAASISFKADTGFITLTLDQMKAIGLAIFAHGQTCFAAEDAADAGINASPPTITTEAQIDALAWPSNA